jgi:activator of HSP90 ATPase
VVIEIAEQEPGHTVVTLTQTGVPDEDKFGNHDVVNTTEQGWRNLIFHRIRAVFGFGL